MKSLCGLRKQPKFRDATTDFPAKWRLRNERRNSILMTRPYPDLGSASDWLKQIFFAVWPIKSITQIWVVTRHQYGISALVSQTSFRGKPASVVAKCRLFFSHGSHYVNSLISLPCSESQQLVSSRCCTWRCHNFAPRTEFLKTDDWPADYLFKRMLLALYFRFTIFVAVDLPSS